MNSKNNLRPWLFAGLAVIVIAVATALIIRLHSPKTVSSPVQSPIPAAAQSPDTRLEKPNQTFNLVATATKLVSGPSSIVVHKDDVVRVNITTPSKDEIHVQLDGYGINTEAVDTGPGGFSFIADKPGTFAFYGYKEDPTTKAPMAKTKLGSITVE